MNGVLVAFWNLPVAEVLRQLQSSEKGLTWKEKNAPLPVATASLAEYMITYRQILSLHH